MGTQDFYDSYWKDRRRVSGEWDEKRLQRVLGPLLGKDAILDYGCGIGLTYRDLLKKQVGVYYGADVSQVALNTVREQGNKEFSINPDDSSISADEEFFDGACSIEVFEHLFDPLAAARELYRVLKPGGVVVATVPNFGYHAWRLAALIRATVPSEPEFPEENRHNGVHIRFYSTTTFRRLWEDAGFKVVQIDSFDDSSIWDVTRGFGPLAVISDWARKNLPPILNLRFLQNVWPTVFAYRIRLVAQKIEDSNR